MVNKVRDNLSCDGGKWIQLAQDRVHWLPLVLAVLNLCVLLPESLLVRQILGKLVVGMGGG